MINPYYFIHESLKIGFKINLVSHIVKNANSLLSIEPKFSESGL